MNINNNDSFVFESNELEVDEVREVALIYEAALNRNGNIDLSGLNFWINERERGATREDIAFEFLKSGEFEAAFGNATRESEQDYLSDVEMVELLYQNVLNRDGEQAGIDYWVSAVEQDGFDRTDLLLAFANSVENRNNSNFLSNTYKGPDGMWNFTSPSHTLHDILEAEIAATQLAQNLRTPIERIEPIDFSDIRSNIQSTLDDARDRADEITSSDLANSSVGLDLFL